LMKVFYLVMVIMNTLLCLQQNHQLCWDHGRHEFWWSQRLSSRASW
jgi:hypothetical protein